MKAEDFAGKKVGEVIDKDTIFLDQKRCKKGFDVRELVLSKHPGNFEIHEGSGMSIIGDMGTGIVICFKDDKPIAIISVYELCYLSLNTKRGMLKAQGHETIHEYWFDDNEYSVDHTR